jgi:heptosyltransferase III
LINVVIYQSKNFGDVLLATPIHRALNYNFPDARIVWIVSEACRVLVSGLPNVELVIVNRKHGFDVLRQVRLIKSYLGKVDFFFDLHGSRRAELLLKILKPQHCDRIAESRTIRSKNHGLADKEYKKLPRIEEALSMCKAAGFKLPPDARLPMLESLLPSFAGHTFDLLSKKFIVVHPGARWLFKSLPSSTWSDVCAFLHERVGCEILITGGSNPFEVHFCGQVEDLATRRGIPVRNLTGELALSELAWVISSAAFFVGVDSFASHLAQAAKTRGAVIFGPTNDEVWGPMIGSSVSLIASSKHLCRPCNSDGCDGSKISDCLVNISQDELFDKLEIALGAMV